MQPVPQMLKRTVAEIGEIEQVNPVRQQTPFDVIKGSIVSTCSNAIEMLSKFTPDDILEYRKQNVHAINFTDFQLSELALPEQLPHKIRLSDALKSREYQYMTVDNFVDMISFLTKPVPIERGFSGLSIGTGFVKNASITRYLRSNKV